MKDFYELTFSGENVLHFCKALGVSGYIKTIRQGCQCDNNVALQQIINNPNDFLKKEEVTSEALKPYDTSKNSTNQKEVPKDEFFKEATDKEKFDTIFTNLKTKFHNKINAYEVIEIFKKANQFEGYSNLKWKQINPQPTLDMRSFSKQFQDECLKQGIKTTRKEPRKEVGLRTKRFLEKFASQEALESYVKSVWR